MAGLGQTEKFVTENEQSRAESLAAGPAGPPTVGPLRPVPLKCQTRNTFFST